MGEETPTPSVHCAGGAAPPGPAAVPPGNGSFPLEAGPAPWHDWGTVTAVVRRAESRRSCFSYKIKYESGDKLCKCFCLIGRRVKSRRNPKRGRGSVLALLWSSVDYSVPVSRRRVLLLDL